MKKRIFIISLSIILVAGLILVCSCLNDERGKTSLADTTDEVDEFDAKTVTEIPAGFILLKEAVAGEDNGDGQPVLRYVAWESQISFYYDDLDNGGVSIYQTGFSNSDFIVKYNNEYYVNEAKISDLIDSV